MGKQGYRRDPMRGEVVQLRCQICGRSITVIWVRRGNPREAYVIYGKSLREISGKPLSGIRFPRYMPKYKKPWHDECCYGRVEDKTPS